MSDEKRFKDYWSDISEKQQGIFGEASLDGTSAMNEYNQAKTTVTPDGLEIRVHCENCGRQPAVTAEFPELIAIKYGLQPHVAYGPLIAQGRKILQGQATAWGFDPAKKMWFPDAKCSGCGWPVRPLISVGEAEAAIRAGQGSGWIPLAVVEQLSKYCFDLKSRGG